ncbi:hypothetical protein N7465_009761 [Penicillium sp. CMV-2018d]|nr:hypothetical protein N7465_009761 [Penicillium sp. CMV-2018d]
MSSHWDVEQCNNKQLGVCSGGSRTRVDGWSPQRRGGMGGGDDAWLFLHPSCTVSIGCKPLITNFEGQIAPV